jgi:flagellar protein FliS
MLYDGAIKQLDHSLELLDRNASRKDPGKIEKINKAILKTQEIITELMVSLDFDQGGEIAANLFSLYTWFNQELLAANIAQDSKKITNICNMLRELRGAWGEIIAKTSMEGVGSPSSGINIAG